MGKREPKPKDDWATKKVYKLVGRHSGLTTWEAIAMLKAEHNRALRIARNKLRMALTDKYTRNAMQRNAYTDACEDIIEAQQKRRTR